MRVFKFDELVPRGHVTVTIDNLLFAVELVMVVNNKNRNDSNEVLRNIPDHVFSKNNYIIKKMPGKGNARCKLVTFETAIELIMVLPGKIAKEYRMKFVGIITRYLNGDTSMCMEIENNRMLGKIESYKFFAQRVCLEIEADKTRKSFLWPPTGFVYATQSAAFPGLIKIGKTDDMTKRLSALNTSCAPAPHLVVALAPTFDNTRDERTAHAFFAEFRREGEFFAIFEDTVKSYFMNNIASQYNKELAEFMSASQGMCLADE